MENGENLSGNEEPFDPDRAYNQMLDLNNKASELAHLNNEDTLKELRIIVKEITRLAKLRKEYYEEKMAEYRKNEIDS